MNYPLKKVIKFASLVFLCINSASCKMMTESPQGTALAETSTMPLVIAHRGLTNGAMPENTIEALRETVKTSVWGVEYDVRLTRDGNLVVTHDEDIETTSDGRGKVYEMPMNELSKYNFGMMKGMLGVRIPLFEEYFDLCAEHGKAQVIEIKDGAEYPKAIRLAEGKHVVDVLAEKIAKDEKDSRIFVGCFTIRILLYAHETHPRLQTCLFIGKRNRKKYISDGHVCVAKGSKAEKCLQSVKMVGVMSTALTKTVVDEFHARGLLVDAWGDITTEEYRRLLGLDVDYITMETLQNAE